MHDPADTAGPDPADDEEHAGYCPLVWIVEDLSLTFLTPIPTDALHPVADHATHAHTDQCLKRLATEGELIPWDLGGTTGWTVNTLPIRLLLLHLRKNSDRDPALREAVDIGLLILDTLETTRSQLADQHP